MAKTSESLSAGIRFVGLGFSLGAMVVAAIWLGNRLDEYLGTSPLFLLVFLVGGLVGFVRRMLWMLEKPTRSGGRGRDTSEKGSGGDSQPHDE